MESQIPCLMFFLLAYLISPSMAVGCCHQVSIKGTVFFDYSQENRSVVLIDFSQQKYIVRHQWDQNTEYVLCDQQIGECYERRKDGRCSTIPLLKHILRCPVRLGRKLGSFDIFGNVINMYTVNLGNGIRTISAMTRIGCLPVYDITISPSQMVAQFTTNVTSPVSRDDLEDLNQDISDCR